MMKKSLILTLLLLTSIVGRSDDIITFADAEVKQLCVTNWDTNADGELSKEEAAAVSNLKEVFAENMNITSFDELQFFTGLKYLYPGCFKKCIKLKSVIIPSAVEEIHSSAFYECFSLESISIPTSVKNISAWTFAKCKKLTNIVLPDNLETLDYSTFYECESLEKISIPKGIKSLSNQLFYGCKNLVDISVPSDLKYIDYEAFKDCESLTSFEIPETVATIGFATFSGCKNLKTIKLPSNLYEIEQSTFSQCENLSDVIIPESVIKIGNYAFLLCKSLDKITIPKNVMDIEDGAFAHCDNLKSVTCLIETPIQINDVFSSYAKNIPLYVPHNSLDSYKSNSSWNIFKAILNVDAPNIFKLTYMLDGTEYKSYEIEYDTPIEAEKVPDKEGYTFSGWNNLPEKMPGEDVTVTGTYTINKYKLVYKVDGEVYKSYDVEYGSSITPENEPSKYGYTFSGWSNIPEKMPAKDVTVTGTYTVNKYKLVYKVDGEVYKSYDVEYGSSITPENEPSKEGYTFSGWSYIPEKMPADDFTITGYFAINYYTLSWVIDGKEFLTQKVEYGAKIVEPQVPIKQGYGFEWNYVPETMPAKDLVIEGTYTTGISGVEVDTGEISIFGVDGKKQKTLQKGLNILKTVDGKTKKVFVK